jgi:hypothetical protein
MNQGQNSEEIIETARVFATTPAPAAPYWEGQTPEESVKIPLDRCYTSEEWNWILDRFTGLIISPDYEKRKQLLNRIFTAIWAEQMQSYRQKGFVPVPAKQRVVPVLKAIAQQVQTQPEILEVFCKEADYLADKDESTRQIILSWLEELATNQQTLGLNPDMILVAQIHFGGYGTSWTEAKTKLLAALDHPDLLVRASAANQINKFYFYDDTDEYDYENAIINPEMPSIQGMMQLFRDKEIARPGIAGCLFSAVNTFADRNETTEWMFDILEHSPHPEPFLNLFSCGIAFYAHERFSMDVTAIRRLMQIGRFDVAMEAATEENFKIEGLEPILMELGNCEDVEIVRRASWHLAYHYHQLHPRGAELGYVELICNSPEIDLFLLFLRHQSEESPYAAVIYPKAEHQWLTHATAWKWLNRIFPKSIRGKRRSELGIYGSKWYQRGYIDFHQADENSKINRWSNIIIGYRSNVPWNPKQLLSMDF